MEAVGVCVIYRSEVRHQRTDSVSSGRQLGWTCVFARLSPHCAGLLSRVRSAGALGLRRPGEAPCVRE